VSVFGGVWAASAFKGATGPCAVATDIGYHIENHKQWISVVATDIRPLTDKFYGYALTGWQRFVSETFAPGLPISSVKLQFAQSFECPRKSRNFEVEVS